MSTLVNVGTVGHIDHGTTVTVIRLSEGKVVGRASIDVRDVVETLDALAGPAKPIMYTLLTAAPAPPPPANITEDVKHQQYGPQRSRGKGKRQRSWER